MHLLPYFVLAGVILPSILREQARIRGNVTPVHEIQQNCRAKAAGAAYKEVPCRLKSRTPGAIWFGIDIRLK